MSSPATGPAEPVYLDEKMYPFSFERLQSRGFFINDKKIEINYLTLIILAYFCHSQCNQFD